MEPINTKIGFCIPEFDPIRLKDFLSSNDAGKWGSDPNDDNGISVVRSTNFNNTGYLDLSDVALRSLSEEDYLKTKLIENDIIIERSGGSANQPVGRVSFITKDIEETGFGFSNFIQRIRVSDEYNAKYIFYCLYHLHSAGITQTMQTQTNGIRNLEYRYYLNQRLPKPSKIEQTQIANFLSTVDKTIQATKNSIAKLEKLKTSLMQNLLTGKMKPDGTWRTQDEFWIDEKFGKVPNGWTLKYIGDDYVSNINPLYEYEINQEFDFLEMAAVENNFDGIKQYDKVFLSKRNSGFACYKNGDILFAKITPCTENGKIAIIEDCTTGIGFGSTEFIVISPTSNIDNYLLYSFLSLGNIHQRAVALMEGTTGRQRVPWKIFKNVLQIPFPIEKEDQMEIVKPLISIDKNLKIRSRRIDHLVKVKKSLMQNLLTGNIRIPQEQLEQ
jgi:type I restriction enzyme S subunit